VRVEPARQTEHRRRQREGFDLERAHGLARHLGHLLVVADGPEHAAIGRAAQELEHQPP
jgi:hypothetical protein